MGGETGCELMQRPFGGDVGEFSRQGMKMLAGSEENYASACLCVIVLGRELFDEQQTAPNVH